MEEFKFCKKCNQSKLLENFSKSNNRKCGYQSKCKDCDKEYSLKHKEFIKKRRLEYYKNNKKVISEKNKKYKEKHKKEYQRYFKEYSVLNKEKIKEYRKKYYFNNKEKINKQSKEYMVNNKIKIAEYKKEYQFLHREKIFNYLKSYKKNKLQIDINYKLSGNLRNRLRCAIKNNYKSGSAVQDLGCLIEELKIWLEQQFQPGMSWDNYGEWHIDHIIPLSSFDLTDRNQLLKACHWFNLRPLWAKENLSRKKKI
jgi:hypothetical protein